MSNSLYERDFYAWANEQAALLRAGKLGDADIGNIAEEIESMGRSEKRELLSRLRVLLMHLLKWRYQPDRRGKSWRLTIAQQRDDLEEHLRDNPSLRAQLDAAIATAYRHARRDAEKETDLDGDIFPVECPFTFDEMTDEDFWPD
jgi:hypothetical protein